MAEARLQDFRIGTNKQYFEINCMEGFFVKLLTLYSGRALNTYEYTCTQQTMR